MSDRRVVAAVALLAWTMVVAGCSGSVAASTQNTVLTVIMAHDWASTDPVIQAIRTFEQSHPDVQVRLEGLPFPQIPDAVRSRIASGGSVDVAQWHAFAAAAHDIAEPLDDLWEEHLDPADWLEGAIEDVEWAGRLYGVPLDTNALVLLTNDDALEAAGHRSSELTSLAAFDRALRAAGDGDDFGIAFSNSSWVTYGLVRAHGGELVEIGEDGEPTFLLDSPEVVGTLRWIEQLVADGHAAGASVQDVRTNSFALFQSGVAATHLSGTWDVAALLKSDVDWELSVVPLPAAPVADTGTAIGGSSLFVPKGSEHRDLAFAFMKHLTERDTGLALAREEGRIPARVDALEDPFFENEVYATVVEALPDASAMKLIAFPDASQAFSDAVHDVLSGVASAEEALRRAQRIAEGGVDT